MDRVVDRCYKQILKGLDSAIGNVDDLASQMKEMLVNSNMSDVKVVGRDFESRMDDLVNMEGRDKLVRLIKQMNGIERGGIKRLEKLEDVISRDDAASERLKASKTPAAALRADGRFIVSLRAAAVIVQKKQSENVEGLLHECKLLKVMLPKNVKALLPKPT